MADVLGGFAGFGSFAAIGKYLIWFFVFLVIGAMITIGMVLFMIKKNQKRIIEINMESRRMKFLTGRVRKKSKGVKQFYISKLRKYLPDFQQKSIFTKGNQDAIILLTDNNGLQHTARIPTLKELKKWYKVVYNIDLDNSDNFKHEQIKDIYLLPTPHENLDWLSSQCIEADVEFKANHWWQSPVVAYVATGFICFMMIIVTLIIDKKM